MISFQTISVLSDIAVGGSAAVAAYCALQGLKSWQHGLTGKAEFEAARNLARAAYRLRDEIRACRSPFISAGEFPSSYRGVAGGHTTEEVSAAWSHVYKNRWTPVAVAIQHFDTQVLEAEPIWGSDLRRSCDGYRIE